MKLGQTRPVCRQAGFENEKMRGRVDTNLFKYFF